MVMELLATRLKDRNVVQTAGPALSLLRPQLQA